MQSPIDIDQVILQACLLEATAAKPGNVHPGASFADLAYHDFVASAQATAPVLAKAGELGVGPAILSAMQSTRAVCDSNPNLGIVLLIAPLAAVSTSVTLEQGVGPVLEGLTVNDATLAYEAIRLAQPGGLGDVSEQDVSTEPDVTLLEAMQLAAQRDLVAAQYAQNFSDVLNTGVPVLAEFDDFRDSWEVAVIRLHLELMSRHPDTLIARKRGQTEAVGAADRARVVLESGWPQTAEGRHEIQRLDRWLRAEGNARNPGTTADLVTASLFAAIREGAIRAPSPEKILDSVRQSRGES